VATVGELTAEPGAANVIPGRARLSVDVRDAEDAVREDALVALEREAERIAERRGVELVKRVRFEHEAVRCSPELVDALEGAVAAAGVKPVRLVSGAGHDAAQLASAMPVGMLFVRCAGGVSHDPAESVVEEDVAVALDALGAFLTSTETSEVTQ
jgi:acetylornithine deacetylase/succinyl-diaminopimelate desuccinylase-like protein